MCCSTRSMSRWPATVSNQQFRVECDYFVTQYITFVVFFFCLCQLCEQRVLIKLVSCISYHLVFCFCCFFLSILNKIGSTHFLLNSSACFSGIRNLLLSDERRIQEPSLLHVANSTISDIRTK